MKKDEAIAIGEFSLNQHFKAYMYDEVNPYI